MSDFEVSKYYNLSVYANSILGTNYNNALLTAVVDYSIAVKFGSVDLIQKQVMPYLPPNTPTDHTKYKYYLFQHRDKQVVLADFWIVGDSVEETEGLTYTIKLKNITSSQVSVIRDQLRLLGVAFDISQNYLISQEVNAVCLKYPDIIYITRSVYNDLCLDGNGPEKVKKITYGVSEEFEEPLISSLTLANIGSVRQLIDYVIYGVGSLNDHHYELGIPNTLTKGEMEYVKQNAISTLIRSESNDEEAVCGTFNKSELKYYELIPYVDNTNLYLIVVVEPGFLSVVTETKEVLEEHLLNILRHCYDNDTFNGIVVREYLGLRLRNHNFNLVKNRLDIK